MDLSLLGFLVGVGFLAGLFGSMLGLGGGIFVVPMLTVVLGIETHKAIGTSIVAVIATSTGAASVYVKARLTNIRLGMVLETVTTAGAIIGGLMAAALSGQVLSGLFAVMLIYAAYSMIVRREKQEGIPTGESLVEPLEANGSSTSSLSGLYFDKSLKRYVTYDVKAIPVGLAVSSLGGAISGLLGVGGGIVKVPVMNIILGVPIKASTATSNFMVGITAAASAFVYYANGDILPQLVAPTVIGVFVGAQVGSRLSQRLNAVVLHRIFVVVLIIMASQMALRALNVNLFR